MTNTGPLITSLIASIALIFTGCASTPTENAQVEDVRAELTAAQNDPAVVRYSPLALDNAEKSFATLEKAWNERADDGAITHLAYIADQRINIAEEKARLASAQAKIKSAEARRKEVLLQSRTDAAQAAERRAQQRELEAGLAREEAQRANAESAALAQKLRELEAAQTERGIVLTLGDILFDFNKASLKPGAERILNKLAQFLTEYPERNIQIEGFTDEIGSDSYNQRLSEQRAESVSSELRSRGISAIRMVTLGYGESYPVATNSTESGRQVNRRVEVIISDVNGNIEQRI